ncbi:hypothetical protein BJ138DRAFT_995246 [Hygrophoropsis aurantiaca]|uniref:Uncharacterized protein n=1 Tax=Hygrophoropsis aurantiaca TaxID=72124 RepID=A0ACB8AVI3_9AGAM|nr:hypothetical protein BJ138DRAFT_995246 [Hygrophoropsis aurantiaca]
MATQMSNQRKRPHCTKCGNLMAGHTRNGGSFVCPDEFEFMTPKPEPRDSSLSPLPSPPESPSGSPSGSPAPQSTFQVPPGNKWHWRNPNWFSPPRKKRQDTPGEDRLSLVPTEPASDFGDFEREPFLNLPVHDYYPQHYDEPYSYEREDTPPLYYSTDHSPSPRPWSPFSQSPVVDISLQTALRGSSPLFTTFRVPREDLESVHRTAEREGKYLGVMEAPPGQNGNIPQEKADGTVWVVVGYNEDQVKHIVHTQQTSLELPSKGVQGRGSEMGFVQLALAGILGGFIVTCGLAFL